MFLFVQVLGCGLKPQNNGLIPQSYREHYPKSDGTGCVCYDSGGAQCVATCASNIINYAIVSKVGDLDNSNPAARCPTGSFVLGCGVGQPSKSGIERNPTYVVSDSRTCLCQNEYGVTCYATCGKLNV